jgi:alpha-glucuronidase
MQAPESIIISLDNKQVDSINEEFQRLWVHLQDYEQAMSERFRRIESSLHTQKLINDKVRDLFTMYNSRLEALEQKK